MNIHMRQAGNTLMELTLAMAISGIVAVPMTGVVSQQLSIPGKVARQVVTDQQDLKSSGIFAIDASRARTFTPGAAPPVYGTFSWLELAGPSPVDVTAQFVYDEDTETVFRELVRGGKVVPPQAVVKGVKEFEDVSFQHIPPSWLFDTPTETWNYTQGRIEISITQTRDGSVTIERLVVDFRPNLDLPSPSPGQ